MRIAVLVLVATLGACNSDKPAAAPPTKEQAVETARKAADEAKQAMHEAEAQAADAYKRLEAAKAEQAKATAERDAAKAKLDDVRKQAAETVTIAKQKIGELEAATTKLDTRIGAAKQAVAAATGDARAKAEAALAELETKRGLIQAEIKKLNEMIAEIERLP